MKPWEPTVFEKFKHLFGHVLTGHSLIHIDPTNYPYCRVYGARPKENYKIKWFIKK